MKLDKPANLNYAATVIRVPRLVELPGLDNLDGIPVLGHQALTQKGKGVGDLVIAFTAETQLDGGYACRNNLFRDSEFNEDITEKGYLEKSCRIRAIKLRGHRSDALLMPLSSVEYTGIDWLKFEEGDTFDTLNGIPVCRKYEIPRKHVQGVAKTKIDKAFKRVDKKIFPEHLETDAYWRSKHLLRPGREVVVSQKLHGTSIRVGRVPCLRQKGWFERLVSKLTGISTADYTYDAVFGSRKVIKDVNNPNQQHFYESDIWTEYGKRIAPLIPEGYIVYGELVGWTPDGAPIQKGYTYNLLPGDAELFVYRVATINAQGTLSDLPWDGVKQFCADRGLKWTPELARLPHDRAEEWLSAAEDAVFHDDWCIGDSDTFVDEPIPLSDKKTVDEGVCLRQEGVVPTILKAKSGVFLAHETKLLDKGESDLESAA